MADETEPKLEPVPGTTGQPDWMNEPSLGIQIGGINWNDLAGIMAMTFHTSGATISDDQIVHAFYAITGWMMESDLDSSAMPKFVSRVREMMGMCEKDKQEMTADGMDVIAGRL